MDNRRRGAVGARIRMRALLLAAALLLLAACGGGGGGDGDGDGAQDPAGEDATAEPTADAAAHDPDATFCFAWSVSPTSLDPDKISSGALEAFAYPIFDTLVHINAQAAIEPMLATSWDVVDGGAALEMKLREDWTFHDGTPFDAEAVAANIERSKTLEGSTNAASLEAIQSVEVVDDHTVRFVLDGPAAPLIAKLATRAGMMISPAAWDAPDFDLNPQGGSGAFELESNNPDKVVYRAVEDYWDPDKLLVGGLEILNSGDDTGRMNAVTRGGCHQTHLRVEQIPQAEAEGLVVLDGSPIRTYNLYLNTAMSEFDDNRVRLALNHAVNRDEINEGLFDGYCPPITQPFPPGYWAHAENVPGDYYEYDPDKARSLLAEAGLADGFEFEAVVFALDTYVDLATAMQAQFADIGVTMNIRQLPVGEAIAAFVVDRNVAAGVMASQDVSDPAVLARDFYTEGGSWNPGDFSTPEITALHEEAMAKLEQSERAPLYAELWERIAEEAPVVHVCYPSAPSEGHVPTSGGVQVWAAGVRQFRGVYVMAE